ncbi:MAG: helicase-related protein [Salinispira sp.]
MSGRILDNRKRRVGDFLRENIVGGTSLDIVSAYFSIYAYEALQSELAGIDSLRFLFGDPASVNTVDPQDGQAAAFSLNDEGIALENVLRKKPVAASCAKWIRNKAELRTIRRANFLHGKMYSCAPPGSPRAAVMGSSNFTARGLGFTRNSNIELNMQVDDAACAELSEWFEELWNSPDVRDAKQEVLEALEKLTKDYAPADLYFKSLLHIFQEKLEDRRDREKLIGDTNLFDTEIWKHLYEFQRHGVTGAINRLEDYGGCIIADSVGLGKTFEALAIIKFYELRGKRVLVLCPKRLSANWLLYPAAEAQKGNPFLRDNFSYTCLAHTDLTRKTGAAGNVHELGQLNWGIFDVVVIDESHNFRRDSRDSYNEQTGKWRLSRYDNLLRRIIAKADSRNAKVLMLSATPVNTSLLDLKNQVYVITNRKDDSFRENLGIGNIKTLFHQAARDVEKCGNNKTKILRALDGDFMRLLDALSIARSRRHVKEYYPQFIKEYGDFPVHDPPQNIYASTDSEKILSYKDMSSRIGEFNLAIYNPSEFVKDTRTLEETRKQTKMDQRDRERYLISMMRVNFMKRLESSVYSFCLTLKRIIGKMDEQIRKIHDFQDRDRDSAVNNTADAEDFNDEDEWSIGEGERKYHLRDLNAEEWLTAITRDRETLRGALARAEQVTPERDEKLRRLRDILTRKIEHPTLDKNGRPNRKVLIFTSYSDTAEYVYTNLDSLRERHSVNMARVAGGDTTTSSAGSGKFIDILNAFSPRARNAEAHGGEIDILIGTDCISEGQNLQDCDMVVNYDIHWNPVRIVQRFGRIDRLGSQNKSVRMVNFWPTADLDSYLNLKSRVLHRMILSDITASGGGYALEASSNTREENPALQRELDFRAGQLQRLTEEVLNLDDMEDGLSMSDLTLDDFLAELMAYLEANREKLEAIPNGVYAVADSTAKSCRSPGGPGSPRSPGADKAAQPGVIFCLRQRNADTAKERAVNNAIHPYYLLYVRDSGEVYCNYANAKEVMSLFGALCRNVREPIARLCRDVRIETDSSPYNELAKKAISAVLKGHQNADMAHLRKGQLATREKHKPKSADDFELITWLIIT